MLISTHDQRSIIFPVIVTVLSDKTTSSAQMPTLLAMAITLILLLFSQKLTSQIIWNWQWWIKIRWWPSQMFVIYILRDLYVMGLQILIAWVINCSHVYEMTGSHCDISLSNMSPGNKGCLSIFHVDPERLQLEMLHERQLTSILWRSPNPWSLAWLCLQQKQSSLVMFFGVRKVDTSLIFFA